MFYNLYKVNRRGNTRYAHWYDGPANAMPDSVPKGEDDEVRATDIRISNGLFKIIPSAPLDPGDYVVIVTNWENAPQPPDSTLCYSFTLD